MNLSIVVPTYRKGPRLRLMLRSLLAAIRDMPGDLEVLVVDDGGGEARTSLEQVLSTAPHGPEVRLLEQARSGRSAARNRGAHQAMGKRVLFLDDDVLATLEVLQPHLRAALEGSRSILRGTILHLPWLRPFEDPETGTLTELARRSLGDEAGLALRARCVRLDASGAPVPELLCQARLSRFERDLHAWLAEQGALGAGRWLGATGAHVSFDRDDFLRLGGFDERLGLRWGAEDLELGYRAEQHGLAIVHARKAVVLHMDHDTSGREGDHSAALEYFALRHGTPRVLRLLDYFAGRLALREVLAA